MNKIAIIGGGIGGLTTAIALKKFRPDLNIEIYERSDELKTVGAGLALAANAMMAFQKLAIQEKIIAKSSILEKFQILDKQGKLITQTDNIAINKDNNIVSNFSISRTDLQALLLAEIGGVKLHLGKRVIAFNQLETVVEITFDDQTIVSADYIIAADGIHSIFRHQLVPQSTIRFAGYTCWRGITGQLPPHFNRQTATETWSNGKRFGIVPIKGGKAYWFACINAAKEKDPVFATYKKEQLVDSFNGFHQPVQELIRLTDQQDIIWNDIIDFAPIKQFAFGNILLLGDAAHATTPNMGQGACQAIEGAVILGKTLQRIPNVKEAFKAFEQKRLKRTAFIVNRSWQIGKIAQWDNSLATFLRNGLFRLLPAKAKAKQVMKILDVSFD